MKYFNKKFSVFYGGEKYNGNYNKIFKKSPCCNAPLRVEGVLNKYYVCEKCNKVYTRL